VNVYRQSVCDDMLVTVCVCVCVCVWYVCISVCLCCGTLEWYAQEPQRERESNTEWTRMSECEMRTRHLHKLEVGIRNQLHLLT
jgi:hypothetical protein